MSKQKGECDSESSNKQKAIINKYGRGPIRDRERSASLTEPKLPQPVVRPRSVSCVASPYRQFNPPGKPLWATIAIPSLRRGEASSHEAPGDGPRLQASTTDGPSNDGSSRGPREPGYPWLYDDATRYMECLDEFQRFSDEWEGVQGWISEHLVRLVASQDRQGRIPDETWEAPATLAICGQPGLPQEGGTQVYRMLGVGSGSGEIDLAILRALLPNHTRVSTTVVEPDPSQITLYRQLIAASEINDQNFRFHGQTSSEFIAENSDGNMAFDLIHMIHVLYHIEKRDLEATFSYYYGVLAPQGILAIAYESDKSSLARIRQWLQPFRPGLAAYMSIADVREALSTVAPVYKQGNIPGTLDVTACLQEDPSASASGERLWDFITRVVSFRANAPDEVVRRAAGMLREFSWRDDDGRFLTNVDTAVIVVTKPTDAPTECK